jgi:hypothetical protein
MACYGNSFAVLLLLLCKSAMENKVPHQPRDYIVRNCGLVEPRPLLTDRRLTKLLASLL